MAFPLFTFIWALNVLKRPEHLQKRANRMWLWAVVTQPIFALAFHGHHPWFALNILFVFALVTQLLAVVRANNPLAIFTCLLLVAAMIPLLTPASYGLQGVVLAAGTAVYLEGGRFGRIAGLCAAGALLTLNGITHLVMLPAETLLLAVLPTLTFPVFAISLVQNYLPEGRGRLMPSRFFYLAYAGHLLILAAGRYLL
jgi:hypothetical protein